MTPSEAALILLAHTLGCDWCGGQGWTVKMKRRRGPDERPEWVRCSACRERRRLAGRLEPQVVALTALLERRRRVRWIHRGGGRWRGVAERLEA